MDSEASTGASAFAIGWRILLAASLAFALLHVLTTTQYYATALVLAALFALTLLDMTRLYARPIRMAEAMPHAAQRDQAGQLDRMTALLDAVTVALVVLDPDDRITFSNRAARLLAGEEVGRLADVRALGAEAAAAIRALPAGARQIVAMADGRLMLVWTAGFAAPGMPAQRLVSLQAVAGELDAVQLRAWQDMTRVLSHEMMNSLTPIASLSETLAHMLRGRGDPGGEIADAVETISRRSRHLMSFVARYRQVADLPEPRLRILSAAEFIAEIDILMAASLANIAYRSQVTSRDLALRADPELLSQAVINLLHNAIDAVGTVEYPAITLSCGREADRIVLAVSDNGSGVANDRFQEIFVPFFTTKLGGSGIGLTLARQIALAHGGHIVVADNPDRGAKFTIAIPVDGGT